MNYRHQFHAGNFADVLKHALLVGLLRAMQRKATGILYLDTHAGAGSYDLARAAKGDRLERRPEHPDGIGRLNEAGDLPELLADYREQVRAFGRGHQGRYPGSPSLAALLARPQDRLVLCEKHASDHAALRRQFRKSRRVAVWNSDGYAAFRGCLPPLERRALVLVDPPFEDERENERIVDALREGLRRLPRGVYAAWYPIGGRIPAGALLGRLRTLKAPCLVADLIVDPDAEGLRGCGLAILNPPWRFDEAAAPAVARLATLLAQSARSNGGVRWLTSQSATSSSGG